MQLARPRSIADDLAEIRSRKRTPAPANDIRADLAKIREKREVESEEPRGIVAGIKDVGSALRHPWETAKGMGNAIEADLNTASSPIQGMPKNILGNLVRGRPQERVTAKDKSSVTPREFGKGAFNSAVNVGFALAPALGIAARTAANAGLGALHSPDDRLRGATAGLALGEVLHGVPKVIGKAARLPRELGDVSKGMVEEGVTGLKEVAQEPRRASELKVEESALPVATAQTVEPVPPAAQKVVEEQKVIRRSRWAPGESIRDEAGALRKDLTNVPDEVLEAELQRITELNVSEEAAATAVRESGYRANYEELPRTERLGRKGQEDLPDADGMIDSDRLLDDNKTLADYNKNTIIRAARARAASRLEAELAARKPEKYQRVEDTPEPPRSPAKAADGEPGLEPDTSIDFGENAPDHRAQPREYLNWTRANYDKTVEARIREAVDRGRVAGDIDKGYQSFAEQGEQARAFKKKVANDLIEDPLSIDRLKLERLTGAEVEGLKLFVGENTATMEAAARVLNDPKSTPTDIAQAAELFDKASATTDKALGKIVSETAQTARSLGYMRNTAKHSLDPEVWLVQAKRSLGDKRMTDSVMLEIRKLAREASEACR